MDCDSNNIDSNIKCEGRFLENYFKYIEKYGIAPLNKYPTNPNGGVCSYKSELIKTKVKYIYCYESLNKNYIKHYLNDIGPLVILVDSSQFNTYIEGVMKCRGINTYEGDL